MVLTEIEEFESTVRSLSHWRESLRNGGNIDVEGELTLTFHCLQLRPSFWGSDSSKEMRV